MTSRDMVREKRRDGVMRFLLLLRAPRAVVSADVIARSPVIGDRGARVPVKLRICQIPLACRAQYLHHPLYSTGNIALCGRH